MVDLLSRLEVVNALRRENFALRGRIVDLKGQIAGLEGHLKMEKATLANWDKMTDIRIDRIKELEGRLAGQAVQDFLMSASLLWRLEDGLDKFLALGDR